MGDNKPKLQVTITQTPFPPTVCALCGKSWLIEEVAPVMRRIVAPISGPSAPGYAVEIEVHETCLEKATCAAMVQVPPVELRN